MASRVLLLMAVVFITACSSPLRPHLPQVEQTMEATHGGGERFRAHQRCTEVGHTVEDVVACMREEGYEFIARGPDYPSPGCWQAREPGGASAEVLPHCFTHAPGTAH